MQNSALSYIKDVLGIESLVIPEGFDLSKKLSGAVNENSSFKELKKSLLVILSKEPSPLEREFIQKMLAAISIDDALWRVGEVDENELRRHDIHFAIAFGVKKNTNSPIRWIDMPELAGFFGDESQIKESKKLAWDKLKALKKEMDTWES